MSKSVNRRTVLRGMLGGAAITVGIPLLECCLNNSGTALADGLPIPTRFGTWYWGLGTNKERSSPLKLGVDYDFRGELEPLRQVSKHINFFSRYATRTDGRPNFVHHTGVGILRCGQAPVDSKALPSETIDVTVSDAIGGASRFRSLEVTGPATEAIATALAVLMPSTRLMSHRSPSINVYSGLNSRIPIRLRSSPIPN